MSSAKSAKRNILENQILEESLCIFCFKSFSNRLKKKLCLRSKDDEQNNTLIHKFFTMAQRNFEEKTGTGSVDATDKERFPIFLSVPEDSKLESCEECFKMVKSYCDIYNEIKCLELELDKILEKLKSVMTCADEEPSKMNRFINWSLTEKGKMEKLMEFRQFFQNHCYRGSLELFPKNKLDHGPTTNGTGQGQSNLGVKKRRGRPPKSTQRSSLSDEKVSNGPASTFNSSTKTPPAAPKCINDQLIDIVIKSSPPSSPIHNDHHEDDWLNMNFENLPLKVKIMDPDWDPQNSISSDKLDSPVQGPSSSEIDEDSTSDSSEGDDRKWKRNSTKRGSRGPYKTRALRAGGVHCNKCGTDPPPTFGSSRLLQVHQNYLHTNGYFTLKKSDITEVLNLTEEDLKLEGVDTVLRSCIECMKEFMLEEELKDHQMYHGEFSCDSCGVAMDHAVKMAQHTICHFNNTESGLFNCGKCPVYSTRVEAELINHYLEAHMEMPAIQATCPICYQQFKYVDQVPFLHYLNYHDLNRLEDPSSKGIQCIKEGCSAYFLTEDQLQHHFNSFHSDSKPGVNPDTKSRLISMKKKRKLEKYKAKDFDFECEFCPKKFRVEPELRSHIWSKHANEKMGMDVGKIQLTEEGLTIDEFLDVQKCVCSICDKILTSNDQLECHQYHHGEFKCNFCDVVKTLATELAVHETVHKISEKEGTSSSGVSSSVNCPRCEYSTRNRLDYIDHHLETHLGIPSDRKRCPICKWPVPLMLKKHGLGGARRSWVVSHYMDYHDKTGILGFDTMPKCDLCPAYFRAPVQLHNHAREIHGKLTIRECWDCGKVFKRTEHLRAHRISLHKVDESHFQYYCSFPDCEHRFERQIELDYHENNGHNEKDSGIQVCPECGKKLVGSGQMASHMKAHANQAKKLEQKARKMEEKTCKKLEKKMENIETCVCEQCGKTFGKKSLLRAHKKRHVEPEMRKHVCPLCGKRFPTRHDLTKHNRSHTGEKRYVCCWCGKAFSKSQNFKIHKEKMHKQEMEDAM